MQAFLATSLSAARIDIEHEFGPVQWTGEMRGIRKTEDGDSEAFFIAIRPEHLMGRCISEYHILAHALCISRDMETIAQARIIKHGR